MIFEYSKVPNSFTWAKRLSQSTKINNISFHSISKFLSFNRISSTNMINSIREEEKRNYSYDHFHS